MKLQDASNEGPGRPKKAKPGPKASKPGPKQSKPGPKASKQAAAEKENGIKTEVINLDDSSLMSEGPPLIYFPDFANACKFDCKVCGHFR